MASESYKINQHKNCIKFLSPNETPHFANPNNFYFSIFLCPKKTHQSENCSKELRWLYLNAGRKV